MHVDDKTAIALQHSSWKSFFVPRFFSSTSLTLSLPLSRSVLRPAMRYGRNDTYTNTPHHQVMSCCHSSSYNIHIPFTCSNICAAETISIHFPFISIDVWFIFLSRVYFNMVNLFLLDAIIASQLDSFRLHIVSPLVFSCFAAPTYTEIGSNVKAASFQNRWFELKFDIYTFHSE